MAFKDYFSRQATDYAIYRPRYPAELFAWLAQQATHHDQAWDCATGNGQAAIALTQYFQHVMATDGSANQISQAAAHPQVTYQVALAEQSQLAAKTIDLITVAQAAHWFDLEKFYVEVCRVAKPGGILALWRYGMPALNSPALDTVLQDFHNNVLGPFWPPERVIVEAGYDTLPFPFQEILPPPFSMEAEWTLPQLLGYFSTWSGTQNFMAARGYNPLEALAVEMETLWEGDRRWVTWPMSLRAGYI